MHGAKISYYFKKILHLGPSKSVFVLYARLKSSFYESLNRKKALQKKAANSWQSFCEKNNIMSFAVYYANLKKKELYRLDDLYFEKKDCIQKAEAFSNKVFTLLGSDTQKFSCMPWHYDFRLKQQNPLADFSFDSSFYYKDIQIKPGKTKKLEKDIKLPWELSRFQHLIFLAEAYAQTKDQKFVDSFVEQVSDWLDENHYLLGPNWVCPMDVGLRAANWVVAFNYFKDAIITESFWQRFICSLYDHLLYLENNWEVYDSITSNHYLSDLIGYFYLCSFFQGLPGIQERAQWCYKEILKEFEKQVFDEGTDYESTTNYHKLVTELFYHFYLLAPQLGFSLSGSFIKKLKKMFTFLAWSTMQNRQVIQIGDNDSGIVVAGISDILVAHMQDEQTEGLKHFSEFGLSLLRTETIHVSLRHHAYQGHQPTAHFHNDAGSITLAINGIAIFVDPGSYVYTPSAVWRNYFRSAQVHNSFFIEDIEPVPFDEQLFYLKLPENKLKLQEKTLAMSHDLYARYGLRACRNLLHEENTITIQDRWELISEKQNNDALKTKWNFTVAPNIILKKNDGEWLFLYENKTIVTLSSTLNFEELDGFYSPSYGTKVACKRLVAYTNVSTQEQRTYLTW